MLAIRLQRVGRSGHAQFRVIVQDSHQSPKSGKFVYLLGSYNPHTKKAQIDTEKAQFYLDHGAQPSERVTHLLKEEGVKLPDWVKVNDPKERKTRNPEKLRKNQPKEEKPAEDAEAPAEAPSQEAEAAPSEDAPTAEAPEEKPAEPAAEPQKPAEEKSE